VTIVPPPDARPPHLLKPVAPLLHPADTMVLLDADIIVTRRLDELNTGRIVAFVDEFADRHFEEWGPLLELGRPRPQPYVNSGALVVPGTLAQPVLGTLERVQRRIDLSRTYLERDDHTYPLRFPDQDALNAILATEVSEPETLEHRLAPFPAFPGLRVVDEAVLRSAYEDGTEPFLLHHVRAKPWLQVTPPNPYTQLLTRLLTWDDVALRPDDAAVPLRLRLGRAAAAERVRVRAQIAVRNRLRGKLGLRRRVAGRR
jgi:lipopolysaccharide biosynthesis glycosyltransferase